MSLLLDSSSRCRVLVVDDNRDAADALVEMLRLWGFSARAAYCGEEAVLAEEALQPALVLLDLEMPRMDGFEVATVMRQAWPERTTIIIALTGRESSSDRELCASVGFNEHVCKPIGRAKLHMLALSAGPPRGMPAD